MAVAGGREGECAGVFSASSLGAARHHAWSMGRCTAGRDRASAPQVVAPRGGPRSNHDRRHPAEAAVSAEHQGALRSPRGSVMRDCGVKIPPHCYSALPLGNLGLLVFGIRTRIAPSGTPHWTQESETALLCAPTPRAAPLQALVGTRARAPSGGPRHHLRRTGLDNWCSVCRAGSMLSACPVELHARVPPMTRWARARQLALRPSSLVCGSLTLR